MKVLKQTVLMLALLLSAAWCHAQGVDGTENARRGGRDPWPDTNFPFWVDSVTQRPEGYMTDANGNVEISTPQGLAWLVSEVNGLNGCAPDNFDGRTVRMTTDIDFDAVAQLRFTPIGSREHPFKGTFDGGGHIIDGLYFGLNKGVTNEDTNRDYGLFGYVCQGVVKDVTVNSGWLDLRHLVFGPDFEQYYDGGLVGFADSLSLVDGCVVKTFLCSSGMDVNNLGGVVGLNRNSTVRNCAFVCDSEMRAGDRAGGVVFKNLSEGGYTDAEICNCFFYGYFLECLGGAYALGGVVCFNETDAKSQAGGYKAIVKNCFAESISLIRATYGGSIIGQNMDDCVVENCYGHIWNNYENAGLFGLTLGEVAECAEFLPTGPCHLLQTVAVGGISTDVMVDALNAWVDAQEDPSIYKRWKPVYDPYNIPMFEDGIEAVAETSRETVGIYPNPTNGVLFVETFPETSQPSQTYRITNLLGQTLQTGNLTGDCQPLDVSSLSSGMYLLTVDGATVKFVVE